MKRVLYSESFLCREFPFPSPMLLLTPTGKDNVFLQHLINDKMSDLTVL